MLHVLWKCCQIKLFSLLTCSNGWLNGPHAQKSTIIIKSRQSSHNKMPSTQWVETATRLGGGGRQGDSHKRTSANDPSRLFLTEGINPALCSRRQDSLGLLGRYRNSIPKKPTCAKNQHESWEVTWELYTEGLLLTMVWPVMLFGFCFILQWCKKKKKKDTRQTPYFKFWLRAFCFPLSI